MNESYNYEKKPDTRDSFDAINMHNESMLTCQNSDNLVEGCNGQISGTKPSGC